jgi:predicted ribosomally synthesized peptide with nif11-like leader
MNINPEIQRFVGDITTNKSIREELKAVGTDHKAVVSFANAKGYSFSLEDVNALQATGELSEEQLAGVAGGMSQVVLAFNQQSYAYATYKKVLVWW